MSKDVAELYEEERSEEFSLHVARERPDSIEVFAFLVPVMLVVVVSIIIIIEAWLVTQ